MLPKKKQLSFLLKKKLSETNYVKWLLRILTIQKTVTCCIFWFMKHYSTQLHCSFSIMWKPDDPSSKILRNIYSTTRWIHILNIIQLTTRAWLNKSYTGCQCLGMPAIHIHCVGSFWLSFIQQLAYCVWHIALSIQYSFRPVLCLLGMTVIDLTDFGQAVTLDPYHQ